MKKLPCLECPAPRRSRGLCLDHWRVAWRRVRRGSTSWAALEAEGRSVPADPKKITSAEKLRRGKGL